MSPSLRLATWNCRMGLDRKRTLVERLKADIVVIPECAQGNRMRGEIGVSSAWHGAYAPKGLGVFAFGGWTLEPAGADQARPWALPLRVIDPNGHDAFTLIAVWTLGPARFGGLSYAEQVGEMITQWESELRAGTAIIAGDFNCSAQTANPLPHLANAERFGECGVFSAYHAHHGAEAGAEEAMTLRWVGRGGVPAWFHCDFVMVPNRLVPRIRSVEVGSPDEWIGRGKSDHAPVIVDLIL